MFNALQNKLQRKQKATYFCELIEEHKNNTTETLSVLNRAIGLSCSFLTENKYINNKAEIADQFNNYFISICEALTKDLPKPNKHFTIYRNPGRNSLCLSDVTLSEIINITNDIKSKTSSGFDKISTKLLKISLPYIIFHCIIY